MLHLYPNHSVNIFSSLLLYICLFYIIIHFECTGVEVLLFPSSEGVGAYPGVGDGDAWSDAEAGQVGRQGALQQVRAPAHSVLRLTNVQALGKETRVVRCWEAERNGGIQNEFHVHIQLHAV